MRITNIELTDINNNSETIYDVKIVIDNSLCLSGIKINLYTDELVVSYPDTIAPVDNKVIDRPSVYHTDTPSPDIPSWGSDMGYRNTRCKIIK